MEKQYGKCISIRLEIEVDELFRKECQKQKRTPTALAKILIEEGLKLANKKK